MNFTLLHDITFWAMYLLAAVGVYVIVERLIFYQVSLAGARRLVRLPAGELAHAGGQGVAGEALTQLLQERPRLSSRHEQEDLADVVYLNARDRLQRHLWLIDTLVTAAPLMGLLGTILGIIDTFQALATSGISDPGAVSKGIGTALFATALGICIALVGLVFNNYFNDRVERIGDQLKLLILKAGAGDATRLVAAAKLAA
jgi:biopolymer transport protein ExbB